MYTYTYIYICTYTEGHAMLTWYMKPKSQNIATEISDLGYAHCSRRTN